MQVWGHAIGTYVSRMAKEICFRSLTYLLLHRLVASTICHLKEHEKVPSRDLLCLWCLTHIEVSYILSFALALYLSSVVLGSMHSRKICGGDWVTQLALSYELDTSGMFPIPIRKLGTTALGKIQVLVRGDDRQWRIPNNDVVEPIRQVLET
ncbi:unnamed protein product [Lactuca saligna]|uniref:Uncharacterized protein n=1 Tax=Lactuca saligna TaxID=75948 RepID=A0AA35ZUH7_LACSI|nr:unnamed protein product [Lactuca saligna]